jgi:hypothetical protein
MWLPSVIPRQMILDDKRVIGEAEGNMNMRQARETQLFLVCTGGVWTLERQGSRSRKESEGKWKLVCATSSRTDP